MCNCTKTSSFAQAMENAVSVEKRTGVAQAVFTLDGTSYFGKKEAVQAMANICCYYLITGEEIKIEKVEAAKAKPEVANEVADEHTYETGEDKVYVGKNKGKRKGKEDQPKED